MTNYPRPNVNQLFRERFGEQFSDHYPLSNVLPIKIGGVSSYYINALTIAELVDAAKIAIAHKLPYRVIGAGTATLVGESGFPGLIIKNSTKNIFRIDQTNRVVCDSGVGTDGLISMMASRGLGGLEFLVTIPGTVGGAVVTGAEALGKKIKSYVREISIFDPDSEKIISINGQAMDDKTLATSFASGLVFPPVLLTVSLQFALLSQEEIVRRLTVMKHRSVNFPPRALGYLFGRGFYQARFEKDFSRVLKNLDVRYDQQNDWLLLKPDVSPSKVKAAIKYLASIAQNYGVENRERITYLGYYQEEND